jgi:hypothetical protein
MWRGTLMYVVEGPANGYTSIPTSVYWAITTMTTVGFGDITPKTDLGRLISSAMMLLGWGTLAVPTGIVTAEMTARRIASTPTTRTCHPISATRARRAGKGIRMAKAASSCESCHLFSEINVFQKFLAGVPA